MSIVIVIPSLEPDNKLINLVSSIQQYNSYWSVVVVNDGSSEKYSSIYETIENEYQYVVLKHSVNKGKGAAIKTAINYILKNKPDVRYVITIDSDGQHTMEDMIKCIEAAKKNPDSLVFGVREFNKDVPFRSKFGNILTRNIVRMITGIKLSDTQTGLRVIPVKFLETLLLIPGDRFEYETNMILESKKNKWEIYSQPIETVYLEHNDSSHFRVINDSIAIYSTFLKYSISSVLSFLIDILSYALLINFFSGLSLDVIFISSIIARILSSLFNYFVNRNIVFNEDAKRSFLKYFGLVLIQISLSSFFIYVTHMYFLQANTVFIKVLIDGTLFFISYYVQKKFIFRM